MPRLCSPAKSGITVLIRGDLSGLRSHHAEAPYVATCRVTCSRRRPTGYGGPRKSAACQGVARRAKPEGHSRRRTSPYSGYGDWKRARKREVSPRRRTEHEESVRPHELRRALNSNEGAIARTRRGMICHQGQSAVTASFQRAVG